jgi:hypothetical protein
MKRSKLSLVIAVLLLMPIATFSQELDDTEKNAARAFEAPGFRDTKSQRAGVHEISQALRR